MSQTCILPEGCPCVKTECPRRGICHECIANHADPNNDLTYCQRGKAKLLYGKKQTA